MAVVAGRFRRIRSRRWIHPRRNVDQNALSRLQAEIVFLVRGNATGTRSLLQTVIDMLDKPGLEAYRYWDERPQPVRTTNPDIPTLVYAVPGKEALAVIVSYARQDEEVAVRVDLEALGLPGDSVLTDAESGERFNLNPDGTLPLPLKRHDIRLLRVLPAADGVKVSSSL